MVVKSWHGATPGEPVTFDQPGNDLRWQANFGGPGSETAYLDELTIAYDLLPEAELRSSHLPVVAKSHPVIPPPPTGSGNGINGRVTKNGVPTGGIPIELRFFNGDEWLSAGLQNTDPSGFYQFVGQPGLQSGQAYYVLYGPNDDIRQNLYFWANNLITDYSAGERRLGGNFDVATVKLLSPNQSNSLPNPVQFTWTPRATQAQEAYDLEIFYPNLADIFFGSVNDGSFLMANPIPGLDSHQLYGWSIWVNNSFGTGVAFDVFLVKFGYVGFGPPDEDVKLQRSSAFVRCLEANYRPVMANLIEAGPQCQQTWPHVGNQQ